MVRALAGGPKNAGKQGKHHASHESESNISVASTNIVQVDGDSGAETEFKEYKCPPGAGKTRS